MNSMRFALIGAYAIAACGGAHNPLEVDAQACDPGFAFDGVLCQSFANRSVERIPTPWTEQGRALALEMVVYRPPTPGPYPTVIVHHGSTGTGSNPALFSLTYSSETIAKAFVDQGWMVLFPQRRGRGASDGVYNEGFEPDRSRYSCQTALSLGGLEHALEDAEVIARHVRGRPEVDTSRIMIGGVSRGGILALAHAARRPASYRGVVNFVGGWMSEGCVNSVAINRTTFAAAARSPVSLWIYGDNDPFYSAGHSRANFDAFVAAGGAGTFHLFRRRDPAASGHGIASEPALWLADVQAFISQAGR